MEPVTVEHTIQVDTTPEHLNSSNSVSWPEAIVTLGFLLCVYGLAKLVIGRYK